MHEIRPDLNGAGLRIAIVRARFNESVGQAMLKACLSRLRAAGVNDDDILVVSVPGALEIPLTLQKMADAGKFNALIALGAVIRGETYHFEVVSNESASGILRVQLDSGLPVANGVLTTETDEQAAVRAEIKGSECAEAAIEMANLARAIASAGRTWR